MGIVITFTIALVILAIVFFFKKKKKSTAELHHLPVEDNVLPYNKTAAEAFVQQLDALGYFKYTHPDDIDSLKKIMIDEFDPSNELVTNYKGYSTTPDDYRFYYCDNETLFEEGGFADIFKDMQPTFDKMGLLMQITDEFEEWDHSNGWSNHTLSINGKKYTIFKDFEGMGWGEAVQRLVEIVNEELQLQNKEDRLYPMSGGNDGRVIFLTENQFNYINSIYTNVHWKPLQLEEWCKVMGVSYMKVD